MLRVDLKLDFSCNNRCAFCVQGDKRYQCGPRNIHQVCADLEMGLRSGARQLVLTGGEPTLNANLFAVIRKARQLGYESVQIQSNGRSFYYSQVCEAAIRAGATEFSPSIHGATAETHDRLTGASGSFEQTLRGIENLVSLGQTVITNTVVTRANYAELPSLARLLVALGVRQFQLAYVHIVGSAANNADWLVARKSEIMSSVLMALDVGRAAGVTCMTEAIPYCLMPGYEDHIAERIIPESMIFDDDRTIDNYGEYRRQEGKAKRPECSACRYFSRCEGPWREYPERFGWQEFVPIE
jgi:MoaA/NifB/PqqE/SkfB family radical SAM enzyme